MEKVKVLAVAPYQGMREQMLQVAAKREDIVLTSCIGDLDTGLRAAQEAIAYDDFDIIISRGGTADLISQTMNIPTLDIFISLGDILQAIKLAENYQAKFAIVGFPSISNRARLICDLLGYDINVYTIRNEDADSSLLEKLKNNGYSMIVGDVITARLANSMGFNAVLITSGSESMESAFDQAVKLSRSYSRLRSQNETLEEALYSAPTSILAFRTDGTQVLSSLSKTKENTAISSFVESQLPTLLSKQEGYIEKPHGNSLVSLQSKMHAFKDEKLLFVYVMVKLLPPAYQNGNLIVLNKEDAMTEQINHYYSAAGMMEDTNLVIERFGKHSTPIILMGEQGTGKDSCASILYTNGNYVENPLYIINCGLITEKQFSTLLKNPDSPLNTLHTTLYFKNIMQLNSVQLEQLLIFTEQSGLSSRCKLICSIETQPGVQTAVAEANRIAGRISAVSLHLPQLRERRKDIPSLVALYVSQINTMLGKQIIGFEPEALEMLAAFDWPYNLDQFYRVLRELAIGTTTFHISTEDTAAVLKKEHANHVPINTGSIDFNRSLNEITYDILRIVLQEEGNNQKKTAERLGIGRSTLWRMLKTHE